MVKPDSIECPPFPTLDWDDFFWSAPFTLPAWAGFQSCGGAYCSTDNSNASGGTINLVVSTDAETRSPPTGEQIAGLQFLRDNDSTIATLIVQRIYDEYPAIRERFADFLEPGELDADMPQINAMDDLRRLVGLGNVHIHNTSKDSIAYIGFELGCTWDIEHGLGVMTHRDRIVEFGGADTAILEWIADRDAAL